MSRASGHCSDTQWYHVYIALLQRNKTPDTLFTEHPSYQRRLKLVRVSETWYFPLRDTHHGIGKASLKVPWEISTGNICIVGY